jgi:cyclophilin family peptidyl-prolyl cis-trans isomerase
MRFLLTLTLSIFLLTACESEKLNSEVTKLREENETLKAETDALQKSMQALNSSQQKMHFLTNSMAGIRATIITNYGNIVLELFPEKAPLHCFNFSVRAESGFYDNTLFHRVIKGFMIQGGDPLTKTNDKSFYGMGGPKFNIPHEFNEISHKRGILSMARINDISAGAGSQFFIMHQDTPRLDKLYTAFGEVIKGIEVVDKIASLKTTPKDLPVTPARIKRIEIEK